MNRLLLGLALTAAMAAAQGPMRGPGRMGPGAGAPGMEARGPAVSFDAVKTYLGLDDAQITKLRDLRNTTGGGERHERVAELNRQLRELLAQPSPNATQLGQLLIDIKNVREEALKNRETLHQQALAILTAEQRTKLAALEAAADLGPAIAGAAALHLLDPPEPGEGPGFGRGNGALRMRAR